MTKLWHATYGDKIPTEINLTGLPTVLELFETSCQTYAERTAFVCSGATLSYAEWERHAEHLAAYFQTALGVKKGDRVAVMTPNIMAFPITHFALLKVGAVQVNVNPLYTPTELGHQLRDAGVETIVIFTGSTPVLAEIIADTPVKHVVTTTLSDAGNPKIESPAVDPRLDGVIEFTTALQEGRDLTRTPVSLSGEDILFLQYTGGTTGLSKGAILTHSNLVANTNQFKAFAGDVLNPGHEVVVTALPLYHIFALMANYINYVGLGGTNHLITNPRDIDGLIDVLGSVKPTAFTAVNTLFNALVSHPRLAQIDLSSLTVNVGGGAAVHQATSEKWKAATGEHIREGYGLSETSPILTLNPLTVNRFSGTVGIPVPSTDIKLLKDDNSEAALGEEGEICAKGPQIMRGYWNREDANDEVFTQDGYFRTGDIGVFQPDGYVRIVDRKKDMVIVSGFNVYPNEIEATVAGLDGVLEAACIGVPDDKTGEALRLFVVKSEGAELGKDDVVAFCREKLTAYKVPRQIRFLDELPKSTVGKILRRELRD